METSASGQLQQHGYTIVTGALPPATVDAVLDDLKKALALSQAAGSIRSRNGVIYAARNILTLLPSAATLWQTPALVRLLCATLGEKFGLVRGLYFDKHPDSPWSLPWHKDLTIAVQRNDLPSQRYTNPTTKAGVQHVEAPCDVLQQMLTLRIHLDDVTAANGPLKVIAGSHHSGKASDESSGDIHTVVCNRGDVLAMRPLLSHSSGASEPGAAAHRRVIHLEFAGCQNLDDGYSWQRFERYTPPTASSD